MTMQTPSPSGHILQAFDNELDQLQHLALKMTALLQQQLELMIEAFAEEDGEAALQLIAQSSHVTLLASAIDQEVLEVLARHHPVANDLRAIIAIAKISAELEKLNIELCEIARLLVGLFTHKANAAGVELPEDIIRIAELAETMLENLLMAFWNQQSNPAYALLQTSRNCEQSLQTIIKQQLAFAVANAHLVGRTLEIIEILKAFDHCCEYCRHIAESIIFMVDGRDVRHLKLAEQAVVFGETTNGA